MSFLSPHSTPPSSRANRNRWGRSLLLLLLVVLVLVSVTPIQPAQGQNDVSAAPTVIASFPAQREVIGPDSTLQLTFSTAMNRASVQGNFVIDPPIEGAFAWTDDATLTFDPAGPLTRGQQYVLALAADAASAAEVKLGTRFRVNFSVTPNLNVSQVIPAPDTAQVEAVASITVVFDRPVVPLVTTGEQQGLPQPLSFDPLVEGKGEWVGTAIYTFRPKTAFAGGTRYTATVKGDLVDVDGSPMSAPYSWNFTTIRPRVEYFTPNDGQTLIPLDSPITVTFNQPMDTSSTQEAFTLRNIGTSANVAGAFTWDEAKRTLTFKPSARLEFGGNYIVSVQASARSASGQATLENPMSSRFVVVPLPKVVRYGPTNAEQIRPGGGAWVEYNTYMNPKSFTGKVKVEPQPKNLTINAGQYTNINFTSQPATTYTITIEAGVADNYGNSISEPLTWSFTTADAQPEYRLATRDQVIVTNAYRPDTAISAAAVNISRVDAQVTALEFQELLNMPWESGGYLNLYNYNAPHITRTVTIPMPGERNVRYEFPVKLAGNAGGRVPPGAYFLKTAAPEVFSQQPGDSQQKFLVFVSTAHLTLKQAPDKVLVWVTDMQSGAPLEGLEVNLFDIGTRRTTTALSDADGLATFPLQSGLFGASSYLASVNTGEQFGITISGWQSGLEPYTYQVSYDTPVKEQAYLYTDQPIYRPARPVYFRGLVRKQDDVIFTLPAYSAVTVVITDPQGQEVYRQDLSLNNFGGFNGKYDIPQTPPLGGYSLRAFYLNGRDEVNIGYLNFSVAEFRPPEFLVTATASAAHVAAGEQLQATIDGKFLFGGPVSEGKVNWAVVANQGYFTYTGPGNYDFGTYGFYYWDRDYTYNRTVASGAGVLDAKGQLVIDIPADLGQTDPNAPPGNPQDFTIEATVTDISNQSISGRTTVTVHPADYYIGLQPSAYVGRAGEALSINLLTVDWASQPAADKSLTLKVLRRSWEQDPKTLEWKFTASEVSRETLTTGGDGKGVFTFTPADAGIYEVEAVGRDGRERIARTTSTVWVQGKNAVSWSRDGNRLTLIADAKSYEAGQTAKVLITSPFPEEVMALITVERATIMQTQVVKFSSSYTFELPLEEVHAPNVYVAVAIFRSSGDDVANLRVNDLRYGLINLPVKVEKQLKVKLTPSTELAEPGKTVRFDVLTTDLNDQPVAAEVGLALSDVATLSVGAPNSAAIFDFFWNARSLSVITSGAISKLIDALTSTDIYLNQFEARTAELAFSATPLAGAVSAPPSALPDTGGGAADKSVANEEVADGVSQQEAQQPTPRTNFVDTPLWLPSLITGADGKASTDVVLPDNLTTWRLEARAIAADTSVGDAKIEIVSTKPLLVRPSTPRFFTVGDEAELAMVVNNNTDQDLSVEVKLEAKGVTLRADAVQMVQIAKQGRARVVWLATVNDVAVTGMPAVDLIFSAVSGEFSDASKPAVGLGADRLLPVYRYLTPDYVSTAGTVGQGESRPEAVFLPSEYLAPEGNLTIKLQPSLAATTLDGLTFLRNYPYQCVEQTVSRFLPNVITYRALQRLGLDKPELRKELEEAVNYAVARLKREQKPDGGWGWFYGDESSTLVTSYALLGLLEAKRADFQIEQDMINQAVNFLLLRVEFVTDRTAPYELNRQAFLLYVLAKAGNTNVAALDSLFIQREKMSLYARAYMAQAIKLGGGDQGKIDTLLSDLQSAAVVSATGIHWEEDWRDWWNWDSNTRSTAIILDTLITLAPTQMRETLLPNVVRWLMVARRGDAWETTQETAWAVMALTNWMGATGELTADYTYAVSLNGKEIGTGAGNADTLRDTKTLVVSVADMLRQQANRLNFTRDDGQGTLYYTAMLHVKQPVEAVKPTNRGLKFSRTYYVGDKAVTSATVGDTIKVVLEFTAEQDLYYVNIDDPIPAGTEIIDRTLQTTSQAGRQPEVYPVDIDRWWGWGWWWFSNTEKRTEKMVLSASYLPRGSYRFVYEIQATSPGTYRVIPPNGHEFYFPEVFGRGAGSLFTISAGE